MTAPTITDSSTSIAFDFTRLFAALRASIIQQLYVTWFGMAGYRDQDVDSFLNLALPLVQAGQETSAVATTTYLQMQLQMLGIDSSNMDIPDLSTVTGGALRNGVPPSEVYSRPFKELWTALSKGKSFEDAIQEGADRLRQLVETDLQLSHTHTSRSLLGGRNDVVGFRRVPTGTYTCALCLVASTQRYHKLDLMPIHPGCDCRVAPIIGEHNLPQVVDPGFLEEIHKAVERQFGVSARDARQIDYRKIMTTFEHGEYGPTLAVVGQKHTIL